MSRYNFHAHGVTAIVEFPDRSAAIQHAGQGTGVGVQFEV